MQKNGGIQRRCGMISDEPFDIAQGSSRAKSRDERLPKEERLAKVKDFRRVYKEGAFLKKGEFVFYYLPNALGKNRIGISIRARDIRLAASRNRLRRLVREVYRRRKKVLKKGFDIVFVVKRDLGKRAAYKNIEDLFLKLAKEAGILL